MVTWKILPSEPFERRLHKKVLMNGSNMKTVHSLIKIHINYNFHFYTMLEYCFVFEYPGKYLHTTESLKVSSRDETISDQVHVPSIDIPTSPSYF